MFNGSTRSLAGSESRANVTSELSLGTIGEYVKAIDKAVEKLKLMVKTAVVNSMADDRLSNSVTIMG